MEHMYDIQQRKRNCKNNNIKSKLTDKLQDDFFTVPINLAAGARNSFSNRDKSA